MCRLVRDQGSPCATRFGSGHIDLKASNGLALHGATKIRLKFRVQIRHHLLNCSAQVLLDRASSHLCQLPVQAYVPQVTIKKPKPYWSPVVHCLQLRELVCRQPLKAAEGCVFPGKSNAGGNPLPGNSHGRGKALRRFRLSEEPALPNVASKPHEHLCLLLGFHAFCHGGKPQALPQANDGRDDLAAAALPHHGGDKTAVHLQLIEGQRLQVEQAGIPGAEVVQGQFAAQFLQFLSNQSGLLQIVVEGTFSDFDH